MGSEHNFLVLGALLYIVVFYANMLRQSATRRRLKRQFLSDLKKSGQTAAGDTSSMTFLRAEPAIVNHPEMVRAERAFLNLVEQAPALLLSLGLFVWLVSPRIGGLILLAYSTGRLFYHRLYHSQILLIALVTAPNYLEIFGMTLYTAYYVLTH